MHLIERIVGPLGLRVDAADRWLLDLIPPDSWEAIGYETKRETKQAKKDADDAVLADKLVEQLAAGVSGHRDPLKAALNVGQTRLGRAIALAESDGRIVRDPVQNSPWRLVE